MIGKYITLIFVVLFIIVTLGAISIELEWTDKSYINYKGWLRRKKK